MGGYLSLKKKGHVDLAMGSRLVEGQEHSLHGGASGPGDGEFSLVDEEISEVNDHVLSDAMVDDDGLDLDLDLQSKTNKEGPDEILGGLAIESFEHSVLDRIANLEDFSDVPPTRHSYMEGLANFHKRLMESDSLDEQLDFSSYNREVVVDSAWTSLSSKPLKQFWENDFWHNMMSDDVSPLDILTSGLKRPMPVQHPELVQGEPEVAEASKPKILKKAAAEFMACVKDVIPQNWKEERDSLHQVAIFRWHSLLLSWHDDVDVVRALHLRPDKQSQLQVIVDIFYNKAPSTLMKRVRGLSRVTNYCLDRGISFPCTEEQMYAFLCEERESGAAPSRMKSVLEACVFARHVLGVSQLDPIINSRKCSGTTAADINKVVQQSTPLTVDQLKRLHQVLSCDPELWNRAFAGMCLFCVYGRSRWNDSQHSQRLFEDRDLSGTLAFLEAHTAVHKTARALQLRHVFLPLVSPATGVTSEVWAEQWLACRKTLDIEDLSIFPLMPAPSASGEATVRALSSSEAGLWLRMLLNNPQTVDPSLKITSHSLKSTCLSYLAKRGVGFEDRLALGYHTSSIRMALTYSRDGASRPLAVLCAMLQEIRHGIYKPDVTRSGRLEREAPLDSSNLFSGERSTVSQQAVGSSVKIDLTEEVGGAEIDGKSNLPNLESVADDDEELGHVTTDSSSTSEVETVVKPKAYHLPVTIPEGTEGWQHSKLRTLHLAWEGHTKSFLCGRMVGKFHQKVSFTRFPFDTPKCRQCFHSKDLND